MVCHIDPLLPKREREIDCLLFTIIARPSGNMVKFVWMRIWSNSWGQIHKDMVKFMWMRIRSRDGREAFPASCLTEGNVRLALTRGESMRDLTFTYIPPFWLCHSCLKMVDLLLEPEIKSTETQGGTKGGTLVREWSGYSGISTVPRESERSEGVSEPGDWVSERSIEERFGAREWT